MNGTACSCRPERRPTIVRKLNGGLNAMLRQREVDRPLKGLNVEFRENTPEEFRTFVAAEMEKWGRVVREAQHQARMSSRQKRSARDTDRSNQRNRSADRRRPDCMS